MFPFLIAFNLFGGNKAPLSLTESLAGEWTLVVTKMGTDEESVTQTNFTLTLTKDGESGSVSGPLMGVNEEGEIVPFKTIQLSMDEEQLVVTFGDDESEDQEFFKGHPIAVDNGGKLFMGKTAQDEYTVSLTMPAPSVFSGMAVKKETNETFDLTFAKKEEKKGGNLQQMLPMLVMLGVQMLMKRQMAGRGAAPGGQHQKTE